MRQRRDPSLINFEHLIKMQWKLDFDEVKSHKYISKIDPNYVYADLYPETILGLMCHCYTHIHYATTELINDLIDKTDPKYFTPHTGSLIGEYRSPLRSLLYNTINFNKRSIKNHGLCLIRKLISKMDFSLPDSAQLVLQMIAKRYNYTNQNFVGEGLIIPMEERDPGFTPLLVPDLVFKGALFYSDAIRLISGVSDNEAIGVDLLYLFNKVNVQETHIGLDDLLEFI